MFKNKKVFITILITLLVLISIYGIVSYKNGNILISKIISFKKAETENQMQTDLTNAISALQTEKNGKATLDDITQEWTQTNLSTYTCTFIDDITISGKKLKMESGDVNVKFVVNQDLTVTKIEKTYPSIEYQVEETNGNILKVLVIAEDSINGIKSVICPDGNIIYASGERTKKPIAINYTMDKEQDYLFQIISDNDDDTTTDKTIRINDYYYNITKTLGKGLTISNTVTKVAYNEPYQATINKEDNYLLDTVSVTMGGETVAVTDGQINIEHVTGDIVINATSEGVMKFTTGGDKNSNGIVDVWDEIQLKGEEFYVIKKDGTTLTLLAKYNLATTKDATTGEWKQLTAAGGNCAFSSSPYWTNQGHWTKYKITDLNNYETIYSETMPSTETEDNNAIIRARVYASYFGATGRLLNISEIRPESWPEEYLFTDHTGVLSNCNFWIGAADPYNDYVVLGVHDDNMYDSTVFSVAGYFGVRPVLIISDSLSN